MIVVYSRTGRHEIPETLFRSVIDASAIGKMWKASPYPKPEIDETEATPVLEDIPEDPQVQIETLNARILYLEAELEERRRSTDAVLEALRPLGTFTAPGVPPSTPKTLLAPVEGFQAGYQTYLEPEPILEKVLGGQGATTYHTCDTNLPPYFPADWSTGIDPADKLSGSATSSATEKGRRY
jgi:hypothetical protein